MDEQQYLRSSNSSEQSPLSIHTVKRWHVTFDQSDCGVTTTRNDDEPNGHAPLCEPVVADPEAPFGRTIDAIGTTQQHEPKTFKRWLSTLRRRRVQQITRPTVSGVFTEDRLLALTNQSPRRSAERTGSWTDSSGLLATMRSATMTLASASIVPPSQRGEHSSRFGTRPNPAMAPVSRTSIECRKQAQDEAARQRSRKRRDKIEELIRSEESYVADLKALHNAYQTLLGHRESHANYARCRAYKTIYNLLHTHDDLLGQLQKVVPFAEFDQKVARATRPHSRMHTRWHSAEGIPGQLLQQSPNRSIRQRARRSLSITRSVEHEPIVLHCAPQVVGSVASLFSSFIPLFATYEAFGSQYKIIQADVEHTHGLTTYWPDIDRAIEALSIALTSDKSRDANRRKALTIRDLLIKPIQRLPRYELLFAELARLTPVCDDPNTHGLVTQVQEQIAQACRRVNNAQESSTVSRALETTWILGQRLTFSNQVPKPIFLHLLGEVTLCGCLYISYRTPGDFTKGSYMICILFATTLILANVAPHNLNHYGVLAGLTLATAVIEETDNGRGLQCHTTPHS